MNFSKENVKKIIFIVSFGIILYCILQNLSMFKLIFDKFIDILFPFIVGGIIAFIVNIPMKWFESKIFCSKKKKKKEVQSVNKVKRIVSMVLSYVIIVLILIMIIELIIPQLFSAIALFVQDIPQISYEIKEYAIDLTDQYPNISEQIQNINVKWDELTKEIISMGTNLVSSSIGMITALIGGIFNTIVALIFSVYILLSKESLKEQLKKLIMAYCQKERANKIFEISALSEKAFSNFITGQFTEAIILEILCLIGTLILQIPYATTISVLIGVTALIPIIGAFVGGIVGGLLVLSVSPTKALIFIIFLIILQQIETNIIYPRVVGSSVGLPGIWVLLAVAIGGSLWGIFGLLIGLPLVSVFYTILKNDVNKRLKNIEVV